MMNPKVSVIIPTFKRSDRLTRAIDSVLNQKYENIEVIVVDDNDPLTEFRKKTEDNMKKYTNNPSVKYIKHSKNKNGAAARNTGIRVAKGKYIAFLDDDDEFLPDKIENQVNRLEHLDDSWGACYTAYKKYNTNGTTQYSSENQEGYLLTQALMRGIYIGSGSNLFVKKEVIDKIGGFDESFNRNQDLEFLVRVLEKYKLAFVNSCSLIVHYEIREVNRTYEELKKVDEQYLLKFKGKIENLNKGDKKKVYTMVALENFKYSLVKKSLNDGLKELLKNRVNPLTLVRYIYYLVHRKVTNTSYGFKF